MKETLTDANFPRTADGRVYHLGIRPGELANRIITVGPPDRARAIAAHLAPPLFTLASPRGFLTLTGRFAGVPVSVVAIGMGAANMDFFVREARECVRGDMVVVRLGSCGGLLDVPVGSVVVPRASVAVSRNYDFDFAGGGAEEGGELPYRVSKPAQADPELHDAILRSLSASKPPAFTAQLRGDVVNASADSFYSSQGRQTSFPDHNADLIDRLVRSVDGLASLEMETFHLFHLAESWHDTSPTDPAPAAPVHHLPVAPAAASSTPAPAPAPTPPPHAPGSRIRAASAQMIFAARKSRVFIAPDQVRDAERWTGRAVLDALAAFEIPEDRLHGEEGSVWAAVG